MKKKSVTVLLTGAMICLLALMGCSKDAPASAENTAQTEEENMENAEEKDASDQADETEGAEEEASDQAAADEVAALIDAIYVQKRTEDTDAQCAQAKAAWDALTDAQKELVEGEEADPDYFGRDTGDASKDDPGNQDDIGENEILVVSFGTSFNGSRADDIKGIEAVSYPPLTLPTTPYV